MRASPGGIGHETAVLLLAGALAVGALLAAGLFTGAADAKRGPECANAQTDPGNLNSREAEKAIRCLINERRDQHGVGNLDANGKLANAAQDHTDHMVKKRCFAHVCLGESGMSTRIRRTGYLNGARSWGIGENLAAGPGEQGAPAETVDAWMDSPPHRANILSRSFEHVGVGMTHGTPSNPDSNGASYTTDFGFTNG
jgi:uncharacterized protein YkwD